MIDLLDVILFDDLGNKENRDVFKSSIFEYDLHLKFIIPSLKTQSLNFSRIDIPSLGFLAFISGPPGHQATFFPRIFLTKICAASLVWLLSSI